MAGQKGCFKNVDIFNHTVVLLERCGFCFAFPFTPEMKNSCREISFPVWAFEF